MTKRPVRRNTLDPAVADILTGLERKERIANLPRSRQDKARRDARRYKITLDFNEGLHKQLKAIADKEGVSISGLVAYFAQEGVKAYRAGRIDFRTHKRVSRCARFDFVIVLDGEQHK